MSAYRYQALNGTGEAVGGIIEASSADEARQMLRDTQLAPLEVTLNSNVATSFFNLISTAREPTLTPAQLALCTQQLGTMLGAGVPLSKALNFVALRSPKQVSGLFYAIHAKVLEGESLAEAMSEYPRVFSNLYLASIEAGEQAGALDTVLDHLAAFQESSNAKRQQVISAMIYPIILLMVSLSVVTLLMVSVMPGFIEIFEQNKQALPPLTIAVINTFDFVKAHGMWLLLLMLVLAVGARRAMHTASVRQKIDQLILRIPGIGALIKNRNAENIARTTYILSDSGMQLVDALKIATKTISNYPLRQQMTHTTHLVEQGTSFSQALSEASHIPPILVQLVESGEASGKLDLTLQKAADILQSETQATLSTVVSLIEPLILIVISCLVFTIVIALLQPIFQLNTFI